MYQKVETIRHIDLLAAGVQVIQYPLEGLPERDIDLSDPNAYLLYEVCSVETDNIKLKPAGSDVVCDPVPAAAHNDTDVQLQVRVIPAAQLISDGNWWIESVV